MLHNCKLIKNNNYKKNNKKKKPQVVPELQERPQPPSALQQPSLYHSPFIRVLE